MTHRPRRARACGHSIKLDLDHVGEAQRLPERARVLASPDAALGNEPGGDDHACEAMTTRVRTASGAAAFVTACGTALNPETPQLLRSEAGVLDAFPDARVPASAARRLRRRGKGWLSLSKTFPAHRRLHHGTATTSCESVTRFESSARY